MLIPLDSDLKAATTDELRVAFARVGEELARRSSALARTDLHVTVWAALGAMAAAKADRRAARLGRAVDVPAPDFDDDGEVTDENPF